MSNCCSLTGSLSIGQGKRGKSLEFTWEGTSLGIRVEGDVEYQFVDLGIEGVKGKEIQLQVYNGYIQWKYADEEEWENLIAISELKGDKGLDGKSTYDLWIENGNEGTIDDFLSSLKGKDGEKGEQGLPGQNGADGKDGITPNVQIGTVTTLEPGQQATVENVGTLENPVFNFGIPKGEDGTGGGSNQWRFITDITLSESTNTILITEDSQGEPFELEEFYLYYCGQCSASAHSQLSIALPDENPFFVGQGVLSLKGTNRYGRIHAHIIGDKMVASDCMSLNGTEGGTYTLNGINAPKQLQSKKITGFEIYSDNARTITFQQGFKISIYGR